MIYETFHRLVFPIVIISVVGSVWITGWSHELVDEANRGTWPALPVPHHVIKSATDKPTPQTDLSSENP